MFEIGDSVVIVTDQEMDGGWVTGLSLPSHTALIGFASQSFQGQRGWISALTRPREGGEPTGYEVGFRLQGNSRTISVREFVSDEVEGLRYIDRTEQLDTGRGYVRDLKVVDILPDPEPEGTFEQFQEERYEAGEFDASPSDVLLEAGHYLDIREASLRPEAYLQRWRETIPQGDEEWWERKLEWDQAEWRRFTEENGPSVFAYIQAYIENEDVGRLDWTPILSAVEQAERGDRTAFDSLSEQVYIQGSSLLPVATGHTDPGVPTTVCFDCDVVVPVSETWVSKIDRRALCDPCFEKAETAGRAKRGPRRK